MVDSGPYPSDGESRPPRKHRHEQRSGRTGTHDRNSELQGDERTRSRDQDERSPNRHRDRDHDGRHRDNDGRGTRRARGDMSRSQYENTEERGQSRPQRDRTRDEYRERDRNYEDRGHGRNHNGRSQHYYKDREDYQSERSHDQYQGRDDYHKERGQSRHDDWERQQERYARSPDRRSYPVDSRVPEHYIPSERSFPPNGSQMNEMEYYEEQQGGILDCHKCRYLCTGRGVLQMLEVILNALVLICIISSYFVLSGFSTGMASGGFGGGYYPFEGQELQEVRQLDQEFTLLRAPLLYGGLTVSLLMGTLTLAILAAGSKHLLRLSDRWLLIEAAFSAAASLGYVAAVGVFLHFALQINSTDVCKKRERLYARNGLTWMNCDLAGTDGGAATFAILLVILYCASAVLAIRAYRERKSLQQ